MFIIIFTPFKLFFNASTTSFALSDNGKYLFPLSNFTGIFNNFNMSLLVKFLNELYRNFPLLGTFFINSDISNPLVILHLPFPVINIFFPRILFFSIIVTLFFSSLDLIAASIPAGPPPIIIISILIL